MTVLINGKMITPKIESLHRLIDWFNNRSNKKGLKLGLDTKDLAIKEWLTVYLTGFAFISIWKFLLQIFFEWSRTQIVSNFIL